MLLERKGPQGLCFLSQSVLGNGTDVWKSGLNQNPAVLNQKLFCHQRILDGHNRSEMLNQTGNAGDSPTPKNSPAPLGT